MSQESRDAVYGVLAQHYSHVGISIINDIADLQALVARKPDLVFLGMQSVPDGEGPDARKVWITQYLDEHGIAYTGSSQMAHELEANKPLAKQRVLDAGLKTSPFCVVTQGHPYFAETLSLGFPLFIKPANRGGGVGVDNFSVAHNFDEAMSKIRSITADLNADSLVERYLSGREFSVAILRQEHSDEFQVMPIELVAQPDDNGVRMLSGNVKSSNAEQVLEVDDQTIRAQVCALAINVFHALGARDYGRIDIRLDEFGTPQFLEANLLPSLISGYGSFPKACMLNIGLGYEAMVLTIARMALSRRRDLEAQIPSLAVPLMAPVAV
jgi:D-alanine-D-alanine ligase